jgi:hypothetical protein
MQGETAMKFRMIAAAALLAVAAPAFAADPVVGTVLGKDEPAVRAALLAEGWTVKSVEDEDGKLEVKATKESRRMEFHVDRATGAVTKVEDKS